MGTRKDFEGVRTACRYLGLGLKWAMCDSVGG